LHSSSDVRSRVGNMYSSRSFLRIIVNCYLLITLQKHFVGWFFTNEGRHTKNKCMIQILTCGLFLTCTKISFLFCTQVQKSSGCVFAKKKISYLERQSLAHGGEFPILTGPLL
jgi:hypothetical protein